MAHAPGATGPLSSLIQLGKLDAIEELKPLAVRGREDLDRLGIDVHEVPGLRDLLFTILGEK